MTILADLSAKSNEELIAMLMAARASNSGKLTLKVTEKGGISCYGLGRFPVSLYRSQWERLLSEADKIKAFILANADKLAVKD